MPVAFPRSTSSALAARMAGPFARRAEARARSVSSLRARPARASSPHAARAHADRLRIASTTSGAGCCWAFCSVSMPAPLANGAAGTQGTARAQL